MVNKLFAVTVMFAVIKVSASEVKAGRTFHKVSGLVNVRFADARVIPSIRYKLQCSGACDQNPWCNAISWDEKTKKCQGFTRNIRQESLPPDVSHMYLSDKDVCLGDGYTNTSGMYIKFFADKPATNWREAETFCISEGGRLVVGDTMEKYLYIRNQLLNNVTLNDIHDWWCGGTKIEGTWKWTTDQPVASDFRMIENEPSAFCLEYHRGTLDDASCTFEAHAICEKYIQQIL